MKIKIEIKEGAYWEITSDGYIKLECPIWTSIPSLKKQIKGRKDLIIFLATASDVCDMLFTVDQGEKKSLLDVSIILFLIQRICFQDIYLPVRH